MNGDGKLDLLVGDSVTLVTPAKGLSDEAFTEKLTAWQEASTKVSKEMTEATNAAKRSAAQQAYQKHYQQREEFMKEDRTGFVWLCLQR